GDPGDRAVDGGPVALQPLPRRGREHRHGAAAGRFREPLLEQHHRLLAPAAGGDEVVGERPTGDAGQADDDGGGNRPGRDGQPWPAGAGVANTSGDAMHEVLPSEVRSGRRIALGGAVAPTLAAGAGAVAPRGEGWCAAAGGYAPHLVAETRSAARRMTARRRSLMVSRCPLTSPDGSRAPSPAGPAPRP